MGDFHKAFEAIDEDGSGEITVAELHHYMIKNNYKPTFVSKWLKLFDVDNSGKITYKHYCDTLGLIPKGRESVTMQTQIGEIKEEQLSALKHEGKEDIKIEHNKSPCSSGSLPVNTPEVKIFAKENNNLRLDENVEKQSTMETFEKKIKIVKQKSKKVKKDKTPKEINVYETIEKLDIEMEESDERDHSNELNSKENLEEIAEIVSEHAKESSSEVNNEIPMEVVSDKKQTKKNTSKEKVQKPINQKTAKDSSLKILKSADALKPVKDEEVIRKTTNVNESAIANPNISTEKPQGRSPKSYPIQVKNKAPRHRKTFFSKHQRHLRSSIKPGVVLILLTGSHKGKRVVFLKQLDSGLLLVTGPFKLNGCPLRRVHQKLVIATKTKIDVSQVDVPEHINDLYFGREGKKQASSDVSNIFAKTKKEYVLKEERKRDQVDVDKQVFGAIKALDDKKCMVKYLKAMFSLSSHDCPHKMMF